MTDIGATLREARLRARIDITEVEQATKIRTKYLRAMEDEEWGLLPGPTFVKSFLRTYADYLGLDSRMLVEEWKRRYEGPAEVEAAPPRSRPSRSAGRRSSRGPSRPAPPRLPEPPPRWRPYALVGVVIVALVVGLYLLGSQTGNDNNGSPPSGPAANKTGKKHKKKGKKAAAKPATPQRVKLELTPTGTVYVCLVDENGKALIPGQTLTTTSGAQSFTAKRFDLNLGNNAVTLKANGKDIPVAPSAEPIGLSITPTGNKPLPTGQRPTCT